ncbi:MAG: family 43 glycosylhydrolase [Bacilli bacterium]|nr:family 43 glycosylhydrolase [Bacilli bacterium]
MNKRLPIIFVSLILLLSGCNKPNDQKGDSETPNLDDVSFPDDGDESDVTPPAEVLPNEGDEAIQPLSIDINPNYFDNTSLHNLSGQWSGYGVHYPSVLKYDDTYYLYQSTPDSNVGIRAFKSYDLLNWEFTTRAGFPLGYITKDKLTYGAKAPQVLRIDEAFYLSYKSSDGYYIFSSDSPEGPFNYYDKLNFDSEYICRYYKAPTGKLFLITGGDFEVEIYEMKSLTEVDQNSKAIVSSTALSSHYGAKAKADFPSLFDYNDTLYLTYSSQIESLVSYRTYLVSAFSPDYSSSASLASSFYNQNMGPLLINTNEDNGSRGLGDLSIIEGNDLVSHYAVYSSYETANVRRLNISPIFFDKANVSISHRDERSFIIDNERYYVEDKNEEIVLSDNQTSDKFNAYYHTNAVEQIYFGYTSKNNNYSLKFSENLVSLLLRENGLESTLTSKKINGKEHEIVVEYDGELSIDIDGEIFVKNLFLNKIPTGKIGYRKGSGVIGKVFYVNATKEENNQEMVKYAESNIHADMYLASESNIQNEEKVKTIGDKYQDLFGSSYLNMKNNKDYARFLVDIKEDGRYGVELVYNASFGKHQSTLGLRLGLNQEMMFKTSYVAEKGYVRTLTAEFNVDQGVNELLIENLSNDALRLVSVRVVKVSNVLPSYENKLDAYAESGVKYVTDFRINSFYKAHETYEGARCFAYIGDNTITDFTMNIEVGFLGGISTEGYVGLGFRCDNFASSSLDDDESLVGYYLEISQYQTRLMKHNYGYGQTIGVVDLVNSIGDFYNYKLVMKGNTMRIYKEETLIFTFTDQFAFSSGHLAIGSNDTNGLIRKLRVSPAE